MYIAVTYIGTDFTPGEVLPDNLDKALIERLLKSGAIREDAPEPIHRPATQVTPEVPEAPKDDAEETADESAYEEPEAPEIDVTDALVGKPARMSRKKGGKAG